MTCMHYSQFALTDSEHSKRTHITSQCISILSEVKLESYTLTSMLWIFWEIQFSVSELGDVNVLKSFDLQK